MQDIIQQFNQGDKEAAISATVSAIDAHPEQVANYRVLASMLINIRAYDQADELIQKALGLFNDDPELRYNWGLLAYQQGELQDALARLLPLTVSAIPESLRADAAYMVALIYKAQEQSARALAFAMTAHDLTPNAVDAAVLTAELLMASGALQPAKEVLQPLVARGAASVLLAFGMVVSALGEDGSSYLDAAKAKDGAAYDRAHDLVRFMHLQEDKDGQ